MHPAFLLINYFLESVPIEIFHQAYLPDTAIMHRQGLQCARPRLLPAR